MWRTRGRDTGAGDDYAFGDYGRDRIDLGSGNDVGIGGHDDILDGGAGHDYIEGSGRRFARIFRSTKIQNPMNNNQWRQAA